MNGIAPHQFGPRDAFEIRKVDVSFVAAFKYNDVSRRKRSMSFLPDKNVLGPPSLRPAQIVSHLSLQVAVIVYTESADWSFVMWVAFVFVALFKPSVGHPSHMPTWAP